MAKRFSCAAFGAPECKFSANAESSKDMENIRRHLKQKHQMDDVEEEDIRNASK